MKLSDLRKLIKEEVEQVLDEHHKVDDYAGFRRAIGRTLGTPLIEGTFNDETYAAWHEMMAETQGVSKPGETLRFYINEAVASIKRSSS